LTRKNAVLVIISVRERMKKRADSASAWLLARFIEIIPSVATALLRFWKVRQPLAKGAEIC